MTRNQCILTHTHAILTHNQGILTHNHAILTYNQGKLTHTHAVLTHNQGNLTHTHAVLTHNQGKLTHNHAVLPGYYLGLWLQFRNTGQQRGVYLSNGGHSSNNHGVALLYANGRLDAIFKMPDGREWRARSHDILEGRWYHVAATWSQDQGLSLYINGEKRGQDRTPTQKRAANVNNPYNGFYIGRANDNTGTERLGQVAVDDLVFESTYKDEREVRESGEECYSLCYQWWL